ncbi:MAG: tyrosine-protein phosphatase [Victivallales bacterium]|nr:tyrosine-protein phosphatase [Victivallales bacterium]
MKKNYALNSFLILLLMVMATGCCCTKKCLITLVAPVADAVIVQHPAEMHEFLQLSSAPRRDYFNNMEKRAVLYKSHQSVPNEFSWKSDVELQDVKLEFSLDKKFKTNAQELVLSMDAAAQKAQVCNFQAGKTVYWRVRGTTPFGKTVISPVSSFKTEDLLPRQITLPGVDNVRDLGGWSTVDGRRMRQGLIFRSAGLNLDSPDWVWDEAKRIDPKKSRIGETVIKPEGIDYFVNKIGIKTELDLRWDGEVATMTESPMGKAVKWIHIPSYDYYGPIFQEKGMNAVREDFKLFADKNNYPIVFHCIAGADRTGTLSYILCGLLGVAEDNIRKDWEVTARDYFKYENYDTISQGFAKYGDPNDPLSVKIQKFLITCGVTQEEIDAFKAIILE